jgi:hypothetical protein
MYGFNIIPAELPHGSWTMDVPDALAEAVSAGILTVWREQGIGLALLFDINAWGTESYEAGRIYLLSEPTV